MAYNDKLRLLENDFEAVKMMVGTNKNFKELSPKQVVNRLLRYYYFDEKLELDEIFEKIEKFLLDNGVEHISEGYIAELCKDYMYNEEKRKKYKLKDDEVTITPLRRYETIKLYESDVKVIKSLPTQDMRKTYFVMMIENKIRHLNNVNNPNTMYYDFYQYCAYLQGTGLPRDKSHEILRHLVKQKLIDIPLFELNKMYYIHLQETGEVSYIVDNTKLDGKNLLEQFYTIFGKGLVVEDYMVIDLYNPTEYEIMTSKSEVARYLCKQGVMKSSRETGRIADIANHEKGLVGDFTVVKILSYDEQWLQGAMKLQIGLPFSSKKLFTSVPKEFFEFVFYNAKDFAECSADEVENYWSQLLKYYQNLHKQTVTKTILKEIQPQKTKKTKKTDSK